jgi:hypothetical protein
VRVELGRAAGQVDSADRGSLEKAQYCLHCFPVHHFGPCWRRIDVTMQAGLIAFVAEVDLQRFQPPAVDGGKVELIQLW